MSAGSERHARSGTSVALLVSVALLCGTILVVVARRSRPQRWPEPVRTATAVGDSVCLSCHKDKATYETTAHRLTTRLPAPGAMIGSFADGRNELRTTNDALHFRMHADSSGFYQTAIFGRPPDTTSRTERVAIVAGSGRKGQSFLYLRDSRLFQLPVSSWRNPDTWINSPGPAYVDGVANFSRGVAPRCLECHATWIESVPDLRIENRFKTETAILGITCERCHGAGGEHVAGERSILHRFKRVAIVNPARLSRERQMDTCAQCHGGLGEPRIPSFTYVSGQRLSDFVTLPAATHDTTVDVHGNKVGLLSQSTCFLRSQMTCLTCHDVHKQQRDASEFNAKCLACHQVKSCGEFATHGASITGHCVDCHMPMKPSQLIVSSLDGKKEHAMIRTHLIRAYATAETP